MDIDIEVLAGKKCPYCGGKTQHLPDTAIYKQGGFGSMVYVCFACDAYVNCHKPRPAEALGRLANKELREAKIQAHVYFNNLWQRKIIQGFSKTKARKLAYRWLSDQINIPFKYCHIGMFDVAECLKVIEVCKPLFKP